MDDAGALSPPLLDEAELRRRLEREVGRAAGDGTAMTVVVLAVEVFDGSPPAGAGEDVLDMIARCLSRSVRAGEAVGRLAGGLLAWVLLETDDVGGFEAAERVRESVKGRLAGRPPFALSAGVCQATPGDTAGDVVCRALAALRWADLNGPDMSFRYAPDVVELLDSEERADRALALVGLEALAKVVDARDRHTRGHSTRVGDLAERIALVLGWAPARADALREAAALHDVGAVILPRRLLRKPTPLTADEAAAVREHPVTGERIAADVLTPEQAAWIRHHHERADGSGYPDGLRDEEIPDGARIIAVAEAWDAMISGRHHRPARSAAEALAECRDGAGRQWCPRTVAALHRLVGAPLEPRAR